MLQVTLAMGEDEPRFRDMINGWIEEETVPAFPQFTQESKAKRKRREKWYKQEKAEVDEMKTEKEGQLRVSPKNQLLSNPFSRRSRQLETTY